MKRSPKPVESKTLAIIDAYVVTIKEMSAVVQVVATSIPLWTAISSMAGADWLRQFFS